MRALTVIFLQPSIIVQHVDGKATGHILVSELKTGTESFASGNGLTKIDLSKVTDPYIPHKNVLQAVNSKGSLTNRADAKSAVEGLVSGSIPYEAIVSVT